MSRIPKAALWLGLAGLLPFVWGALLVQGLSPSAEWRLPTALTGDGRVVMLGYGGIILSFMAGVLWGFATKAQGPRAPLAYALSVLPALWWFLAPPASHSAALINLVVGFLGLLALDYVFAKWALTPPWWMALRVLLTAIVVVCLLIGVLS